VADASAATIGTFGHGYTYSGHPLACAVALETLKIYESDRIVEPRAARGAAAAGGAAPIRRPPAGGRGAAWA
jgi:4-aminobutyrate--pyruvate transaminase